MLLPAALWHWQQTKEMCVHVRRHLRVGNFSYRCLLLARQKVLSLHASEKEQPMPAWRRQGWGVGSVWTTLV